MATTPSFGLMSIISGSGSRKSSRRSKSSRVEAGASFLWNPLDRRRFFKFCWSSLLSVAENTNVCMGRDDSVSSVDVGDEGSE